MDSEITFSTDRHRVRDGGMNGDKYEGRDGGRHKAEKQGWREEW